ncbi:hypothetical protein STRDD04_01376 [Streptococcus sp. DD04]|nr:hypothetical protein STRDD04_01376 [Streptococcus sp. DD04]
MLSLLSEYHFCLHHLVLLDYKFFMDGQLHSYFKQKKQF